MTQTSICTSGTDSEPSQISKIEHFANMVNSWKPLATSAESSILDVSLGSEYASALSWTS